jgi:hypothetical protein
MAWAAIAQGVGEGMGSIYDIGASAEDARTSKAQGYLTADANETRVRARNAQQLGEQRASAVESGFDANSGSLATVQTQSAGNLELDALNQRYGAGERGLRRRQLDVPDRLTKPCRRSPSPSSTRRRCPRQASRRRRCAPALST